MAQLLIERKKDGQIPKRYQKMAAAPWPRDLGKDVIQSSLGLPRAAVFAGIKPNYVDSRGWKYFLERKTDPMDPDYAWYAFRIPSDCKVVSIDTSPPVLLDPKTLLPVPMQIKCKWTQLPNKRKGYCMGRICLSIKPV